MRKKIKCALIGPGNIGTDLLYKLKLKLKLKRSAVLEPVWTNWVAVAWSEARKT